KISTLQTDPKISQPLSTLTSNSPLPKYTYSVKTQPNPQLKQNLLSQTI
ncbi:14400_t:CDS:1, partial [Dentiscutata heterogama]